MSYLTQAKLAADQSIILRVTACAVSEGVEDPGFWAQQHAWQLSAQPGWDAAYASAVAAKNPAPGADEAAISDGMILSAVQTFRPPPEQSSSPAK